MSISSSLAAGISGLNANAERLATVSDNIANASTFGYKRATTDFHSIVLASGQGGYSAGGVSTSNQRNISQAGQIQRSENATDIAIDGRGFVPVMELNRIGQGGNPNISLATTGSFRPNAEGFLVDATGNTLMGWQAAVDGTIPAAPRDSSAGLRPVNVFHNQYVASPTANMTVAVNLPAGAAGPDGTGEFQEITMEYIGNLGQTETLQLTYTPTGADNEWTMSITDSASNGAEIANYTITFNGDPEDGGTIAGVVTNVGDPYDDVDGTLLLTTGEGVITMGIGRPDVPNGMTQLAGTFAPITLTKDGAPVGNLLGVEIDGAGLVNAVYDSGFTRTIFQVPVVDVANPDGLRSQDNQTYKITEKSGGMFLWDAGTGPVGETVGFAREASTVDVAEELTTMIQTQRSYSSNAKVIQTVDEMLQETANLKR